MCLERPYLYMPIPALEGRCWNPVCLECEGNQSFPADWALWEHILSDENIRTRNWKITSIREGFKKIYGNSDFCNLKINFSGRVTGDGRTGKVIIVLLSLSCAGAWAELGNMKIPSG